MSSLKSKRVADFQGKEVKIFRCPATVKVEAARMGLRPRPLPGNGWEGAKSRNALSQETWDRSKSTQILTRHKEVHHENRAILR
jgi:hypothetical protein